MSGAHTPGPWRVGVDGKTPSDCDPMEVAYLPHRDYDAVEVFAPLRANVDPYTCALAEFNANARLISAAPELLEALSGLLAKVDQMDRPPSLGGGVLPVDKALATGAARAAIDKAEGRT